MMRSDLEDMGRLEKLEEIILELKELSDTGAILIVEGKKDVESLRFLGINGDIQLASRKPLLEFTELLAKSGKEIVLLTDWDEEGSSIAKKITRHLWAYGIIPNNLIRSRLRSLSKKRIKDIESLNNYVNKLRYEIHGITRFFE